MAKGKQEMVELGNGETSGNGLEPVASDAHDIGSIMWQKWLTPGPGATFAERWGHLSALRIGAYGPFRAVREIPTDASGRPCVTIYDDDAVAYILGEIPSPAQEGPANSFYEAIAKAARPTPHNHRRNFGEELFDRVVDKYIQRYNTYDEVGAETASEKKEAWDLVANGFRNTPAEKCSGLDAFLIAEANDLRDSDDMRRKEKTRGEKAAPAPKAEKPKIVISADDLLARLGQ